jgi:hypothetical protein
MKSALWNAQREYTRNMQKWLEKLPCSAETLAWELGESSLAKKPFEITDE